MCAGGINDALYMRNSPPAHMLPLPFPLQHILSNGVSRQHTFNVNLSLQHT
uniref:Uncharacterized protein n=1 Tax=Myoviridae sp. ctKhy9 TaxID=2827677 RepID=A0A8S5SKJ3_9CAUD|nr:MAG TPA: hypothetical protein [Myoviridae sp. ctKhy9]